MRVFLFLLFFFAILNGRENPFVPVINNNSKTAIVKRDYLKEVNTTLPSDARILKSVTFTYQTLTGSILEQTTIVNKAIDWHSPIYVTQRPVKNLNKNNSYKKGGKITKLKVAFLTLFIQNEKYRVLIKTDDDLIRNFVLVKPFRLVLDFEGEKNFLFEKKTTDTFLKKVVIGNHDEFYRVVLYTDGIYKPIIKKVAEGYLIAFK